MKPRTEKSMELYHIMLKRGYPEEFCDQVTKNLNTDWTAQRMIGYLSHYKKLPMEEIADEMLAILSDRNRIMQKKHLEDANASWNGILYCIKFYLAICSFSFKASCSTLDTLMCALSASIFNQLGSVTFLRTVLFSCLLRYSEKSTSIYVRRPVE